jgi:branched-chain amino acid transport system substrate-binding protein
MLKRCRTKAGMGVSALVVVTALVAGCGSSSHNAQSGTATTTQGTTQSTSQSTTQGGTAASTQGCTHDNARGVTGSTINVAGLVSILDFGTGAGKAAAARFAQASSDGEIPCGRKINYIATKDDQGTPDGNLSAIRTLVQQNSVFGIAPALSPFIESGGVYINQQKVPTVGWGVAPSFCPPAGVTSTYLFGFNGCLVQYPPTYAVNIVGPATVRALKLQGKDIQGMTSAVIGDDYDSSKSGVTVVSASLVSSGLRSVYAKNPFPAPPAVVSDFSPEVQALMTANNGKPADVIYSASGPATAFGLCRALQQAGFKGLCEHSTYAPSLAATAKGDTVQNTFATTESPLPAMAKIVALLHSAGVTDIGQPELAAYYSADMFVQILKKVGPDLTPQAFQQAAKNFTYQIPGIVGPTYYPQSFQQGSPCGELVYSNGVKWSIAAPYACGTTNLMLKNGQYVTIPWPGTP